MNKKIKNIAIVLCLALFFSFCFLIKNNVFADESPCLVICSGTAKIEVVADHAVLSFNCNVSSEQFDNGQNAINNLFVEANSKVKKLDENNLAYITYTSCHPFYQDSLKGYKFSISFDVKTSNLNSVNDIIKEIGELDNVSFYGVNYELSDLQNVYLDALTKAKEDAIKKAQVFNSGLKLNAILKSDIYSYSCGEAGKICVESTVKGIFIDSDCGKSDSSNQNLPEQQESAKSVTNYI